MFKWLVDWVKSWFKKEDPEPDPNTDALDLSKVRWLGPNYAGAHKSAHLNSASMNNRHLYITDACPSKWPKQQVGVTVQGIACIFYERGNEIVGGKFDWWRPGQTTKVLHNLDSGYNGHTMPSSGAKCWAMSVSTNGSLRTNVVAVSRK